MSTTSKLEEAEHKVQTLQTGVLFFMLVELMQGRLTWGKSGWSQVSPGPSAVCGPAVGSLEEEGNPRSRMPRGAPASPPWLLLVTHTELLMSRWEDLNYIFILSTSHSFSLLFFQQTHLNPNCQGLTFHLEQY